MSELLGALGLAWPRLLLYPGGLFALLAGRLLELWLVRRGCATTRPAPRGALWLVALVPPLAAVSLLPLAPARSFPYGLDLPAALALLAWPAVLAGGPPGRDELLRVYSPLLLAALGMAGATRGLELAGLLGLPEPWVGRGLLGCAAALWLLALPRLLAWRPAGAGGELQALGLLLIGALPLLGALAATTGALIPGAVAGWVLPPVAVLLAGLALGGAAMLPERARAAGEIGLGAAILALLALGLAS